MVIGVLGAFMAGCSGGDTAAGDTASTATTATAGTAGDTAGK